MARGKKDLAGFGEVAGGTNDNANANDDNNINENAGENKRMSGTTNSTAKVDFLDELMGERKKKDEPVLTGVYLHKEIATILDRLGKKGGRGAKSRIVNDALRQVFKEKGLL